MALLVYLSASVVANHSYELVNASFLIDIWWLPLSHP